MLLSSRSLAVCLSFELKRSASSEILRFFECVCNCFPSAEESEVSLVEIVVAAQSVSVQVEEDNVLVELLAEPPCADAHRSMLGLMSCTLGS